MGLGEEEQKDKFGFLLEALAMGAPPHGGFAMGIDRFIARMADEPDLRQVVAFPKIASGSDPLTGGPTPMPDSVLKELGIRSIVDPSQA
jgi:aspartyl-tRNA synthetase